jgi:hypothetical protein
MQMSNVGDRIQIGGRTHCTGVGVGSGGGGVTIGTSGIGVGVGSIGGGVGNGGVVGRVIRGVGEGVESGPPGVAGVGRDALGIDGRTDSPGVPVGDDVGLGVGRGVRLSSGKGVTNTDDEGDGVGVAGGVSITSITITPIRAVMTSPAIATRIRWTITALTINHFRHRYSGPNR